MHLLPYDFTLKNISCYEKLNSYILLNKLKLPVLRSVLLEYKDYNVDTEQIKSHLKSNYCIVRFLYRNTTNHIIDGGILTKITTDDLKRLMNKKYQLWLLEPMKRVYNKYGINIYFKKDFNKILIEIVGKGFDVSDINKGIITPHESIYLRYPIEKGYYDEWWKFLNIDICTKATFKDSINIRTKKLQRLSIEYNYNSFDDNFHPISINLLEKLLIYIEQLSIIDYNDFVVSCSIDDKYNYIFWDIQTQKGKMNAYL